MGIVGTASRDFYYYQRLILTPGRSLTVFQGLCKLCTYSFVYYLLRGSGITGKVIQLLELLMTIRIAARRLYFRCKRRDFFSFKIFQPRKCRVQGYYTYLGIIRMHTYCADFKYELSLHLKYLERHTYFFWDIEGFRSTLQRYE